MPALAGDRALARFDRSLLTHYGIAWVPRKPFHGDWDLVANVEREGVSDEITLLVRKE